MTVSGQVAFFTPADVLFHPDNIDLLGEQKQFYLCHRVLAEGDGHVWIISSCHLTNPNWHLLWFSSQLLKIARQPTCCRCVLGLLCNSSVSYTARYTRPSLRMQDKRFPHPKYKWVVRGLDCFIHRFIFICGGCLSYTVVAAFNPHTSSPGLPSQSTQLWIFPIPIKCALLEMADYQDIKGKLHGLLPDCGDLAVRGFFEVEEADLRVVLGPSEQLNPGGDLNGIKRWKRPMCEEEVPMRSLLRGKPGNTHLRKRALDW